MEMLPKQAGRNCGTIGTHISLTKTTSLDHLSTVCIVISADEIGLGVDVNSYYYVMSLNKNGCRTSNDRSQDV